MSDKSNLIPLLVGVACAGGLFLSEYAQQQQELSTPFAKAARSGQLTDAMGQFECQQANDIVNGRVNAARGDNKFVPVQRFIYHCDQAVVVTDPPAKAPAGP